MTSESKKTVLQNQIDIRAPRDVIWDTLLGDETFRDWCSAFCPGTYYEGDWSVGGTMRFLGTDQEGKTGGMLTRVVEHVPGEIMRCEHFGVIEDGKEVTSGTIFDEWIPGREEYRLSGGPEVFTLKVENDIPVAMAEWFSATWDKALARLKEIAEERARG